MHKKKLKYDWKEDKNIKIILMTYFFSIIGYLFYLLSIKLIDNNHYSNGVLIYFFSWVGIFLVIYVLYTWYKVTGYLFTSYTIFMLFFFLFNYGQPLLWVFGVHNENEIGKSPIFPGLGTPNTTEIVKAQIFTLICIFMFHTGALISSTKRNIIGLKVKKGSNIQNEDTITSKAIFYSCLIIGVIVVPYTLYNSFLDFQISIKYGYKSLYYSDFAATEATFLGLLSRMFFPCLVGLLIGSRYNKKVMLTVYLIFSLYLILNLLSGDRGSWIYGLIILIWLSHLCYKPIKLNKTLMYLTLSMIGLYIVDAIVSIRDIGRSDLSIKSVLEAVSIENSPLISAIFEMGGSMKPVMVLQMYGWDVWPYANTYLLAVLGMVTNKFIYLLDIPFDLISNWFSQDYLGLSYGAGFSINAEVLLNAGPLFSPLFMIVLGYLITSLIYVDKSINYKTNPLKFLFVVGTLYCFVSVSRNFFHLLLKDWFYGVIVLCIYIYIFRKVIFFQKRIKRERKL